MDRTDTAIRSATNGMITPDEVDGIIGVGRMQTDEYVARALFVIAHIGYITSAAARGRGCLPTWSEAWRLDDHPTLGDTWAAEHDARLVEAEQLITWACQNTEASEYARELRDIVAEPEVGDLAIKLAMLAGSVPAWHRHQTQQQELARLQTQPASHVGSVGQPLETTVTVDYVHTMHTQYGWLYRINLRDTDNNRLSWKTSSPPDELCRADAIGSRILIKGKVKAHEQFRGLPQTELSHVKLQAVLSPGRSLTDTHTAAPTETEARPAPQRRGRASGRPDGGRRKSSLRAPEKRTQRRSSQGNEPWADSDGSGWGQEVDAQPATRRGRSTRAGGGHKAAGRGRRTPAEPVRPVIAAPSLDAFRSLSLHIERVNTPAFQDAGWAAQISMILREAAIRVRQDWPAQGLALTDVNGLRVAYLRPTEAADHTVGRPNQIIVRWDAAQDGDDWRGHLAALFEHGADRVVARGADLKPDKRGEIRAYIPLSLPDRQDSGRIGILITPRDQRIEPALTEEQQHVLSH